MFSSPRTSPEGEQFAGINTAQNASTMSGNASSDDIEPFDLDISHHSKSAPSVASSTVTEKMKNIRPTEPSNNATDDGDATPSSQWSSRKKSLPGFKRECFAALDKNVNKDNQNTYTPAMTVSSLASLGESITNSAPTILICASSAPLLFDALPLRSAMSARTLEESLHRRPANTSSDHGKGGPVHPRRRRSVAFDQVIIREYERVLGDNPSVTCGPPLSIGWRYSPIPLQMSIDDYEDGKGFPRTSAEFLVPKSVREVMLKEHAEVSRRKMVDAVRTIQKEKAQRRRTVVNLSMAPTEECIEGVKRKVKSIVSRKSSYSYLETKLWDQAHVRATEKARELEGSLRRGAGVSSRDVWSVGTPINMIIPSKQNSIDASNVRSIPPPPKDLTKGTEATASLTGRKTVNPFTTMAVAGGLKGHTRDYCAVRDKGDIKDDDHGKSSVPQSKLKTMNHTAMALSTWIDDDVRNLDHKTISLDQGEGSVGTLETTRSSTTSTMMSSINDPLEEEMAQRTKSSRIVRNSSIVIVETNDDSEEDILAKLLLDDAESK